MLIYTFKDAPFKSELLEMNTDAFIFGRLKEDFSELAGRMMKENPEMIVGIANSSGETMMADKAVNLFNNERKIEHEGPDSVMLHVPQNLPFKRADKATDSVHNWTAYKLSRFAKQKRLRTKIILAHVNQKDIGKFLDSLTQIE